MYLLKKCFTNEQKSCIFNSYTTRGRANMFYNLLKKYNITQVKIAECLRVSQQSVSKWCKGKCEPSLSSVIKISETYNIPIEEIVLAFKKEEVA